MIFTAQDSTLADLILSAQLTGQASVWLAGELLPMIDALPENFWRLDQENYWKVIGEGASASAVSLTGSRVTVMRADDPRWGFADLGLLALCDTLNDLDLALGTPIALGPGSVGLRMLARTLYKRPGWKVAAAPVHPAGNDISGTWPAPPGDNRVCVVDVNSAYLAAARSADFGAGNPSLLIYSGGVGPLIDVAPYGLYHLTGCGNYTLGEYFPFRAGWYPRSLYRLISTHADWVECEEAYIWPGSHRVLRPWGDQIWSARQTLAGNMPAVQAVKAITTATIGMFAHKRDGAEPAWWYRPDWRAEIIGLHAAKMIRTIEMLESYECPVLAAYIDSLAIAVPASREVAPLDMTPGKCGAWKPVATFEGRDARELVKLAANPKVGTVNWYRHMSEMIS